MKKQLRPSAIFIAVIAGLFGTVALGVVGSAIDSSGGSGIVTPVTVANGGTGLTTLTDKAVILGAGTSNVTFVAPSTSGNLLTSNGTTWASTAPAVATLTGFTAAESTASPNNTVYVDSLTASGSTTNVDIAFNPKGTGALLGEIPDSLAANGNKRGPNSTDWQRLRSAATMVASGDQSSIGGGRNNTASGTDSAVSGGASNSATSTTAFVGGGSTNTASASSACVTGGTSNVASTSYATVGGGFTNTASGVGYSTVSGGSSNTASGLYASSGGGLSNLASGNYSTVPGGNLGTTRGLVGRFSYASDSATIGSSQMGILVLRATTTNATITPLTADGSAITATTVNALPNNHTYLVRTEIVARQAATGDTKAWTSIVLITRGANAAATTVVGSETLVVVGAAAGAAAWDGGVDPDTTYGAAVTLVAGEAAKTINWTATQYTTEAG